MWKQFRRYKVGVAAFTCVVLFFLIGLYAPFFASSKPFVVLWKGHFYFPFFRYLFYPGFYTKPIDLFYNLLMFTFPIAMVGLFLFKARKRKMFLFSLAALQLILFAWIVSGGVKDPEQDEEIRALNQVVRYSLRKAQHERLGHARLRFQKETGHEMPTLFAIDQRNGQKEIETPSLQWMIPALVRPFHWEENAGGSQLMNQYVPWWELTRINRKDLFASLLFGVRISLFVGIAAVAIGLMIGIPLGTVAGYFAGKVDLVIFRGIEIWEAMPTFFMLLLIVAITQHKSLFLVIIVLGLFGWTSFSRFIRGEVLKQRELCYVLACKGLGYPARRIMFGHILPNAISPILTLLPFAMMGAISSEAALSFLGLGEEGATSWGVLMDEGRSVFPGESYLLWPPALLLTIVLIAIALVGDTLRDALDPKLR